MTIAEKMNWLERNPVIAFRQIDYLFTKFSDEIMSCMHNKL